MESPGTEGSGRVAVGVTVPGHVRRFRPAALPEWAHAVEEAGFATIAVSDRPTWSTPEPLAALAALAATTTRPRLLSSVLLGPLRGHPGLFATAAATIDGLAGTGRLRLGIAPGSRPADYAGSGVEFRHRGREFDTWLSEVRSTWAATAGTDLGPPPLTPGGPALLFGGSSAPTVRRAARFGAGWIGGGTDPAAFSAFAARVRAGFTAAGRDDRPWFVVTAQVSLGPDGEGVGLDALRTYYADHDEAFVRHALEHTATTPDAVRALITDYAAAGADEIVLTPNHPEPASIVPLRRALDDLDVEWTSLPSQ